MSVGDRFRVNSPDVAWEDFDDEVIMVHFESGQYFSTREVGSEILRRLEKGAPVTAVEQAIIALYDVEAAVAAQSLSTFVAELREHGLIVPRDDAAAVPWRPESNTEAKRPFLPPVLETYSDMQDLLLLDPIHEVDDSGWPNPR